MRVRIAHRSGQGPAVRSEITPEERKGMSTSKGQGQR